MSTQPRGPFLAQMAYFPAILLRNRDRPRLNAAQDRDNVAPRDLGLQRGAEAASKRKTPLWRSRRTMRKIVCLKVSTVIAGILTVPGAAAALANPALAVR